MIGKSIYGSEKMQRNLANWKVNLYDSKILEYTLIFYIICSIRCNKMFVPASPCKVKYEDPRQETSVKLFPHYAILPLLRFITHHLRSRSFLSQLYILLKCYLPILEKNEVAWMIKTVIDLVIIGMCTTKYFETNYLETTLTCTFVVTHHWGVSIEENAELGIRELKASDVLGS